VPLPPSIQLEPLINVHKQRLIADVIKMLVAGQHLASRVQHPVDKKTFPKMPKDTWIVLGHVTTSAGDVRMSCAQ